ncbi:MAG: thiamine phosphate synthase [Oscillatoriales cyanobacterium SM2_2_1]|nr:thiamine phosphate synthase [Oscillatoriales cyanobacterium SM2_2_1]
MTIERHSLYRILDANLDRAREALRVLEEWGRLGRNDRDLTAECKGLRHTLAQWHREEFRAARNTPSDVGTELTHGREQTREHIPAVLRANCGRLQESLRVLEEYGKVYDPLMGAAMKGLRYQAYTLEQRLAMGDRQHKLSRSLLYLVTMPVPNLLAVVRSALEGGVDLVQYREKEGIDRDRLALAEALRGLCAEFGVLFLVNDRIDLALAVDADGVHLGQQDLPVAIARQLLGHDKLIGLSTTNPDELSAAMATDVDYVGVGPVYATPTKPGKSAAGFEYVRYAAAQCDRPFFAIGGVDLENVAAIREAGAQRVAVVRALMAADDPQRSPKPFAVAFRNQSRAKIEIFFRF